jgi:hypothetical protein
MNALVLPPEKLIRAGPVILKAGWGASVIDTSSE